MAKKTTDFSQVISAIKDLRTEFMGEIEKVRAEKNVTVSMADPLATVKEEGKTDTTTFPIPEEYRRAVNDILSDKFGIKVIPSTNSPDFLLQILVPQEYSNAGEQIWKDAKADIRSKVLTYGEGLLGVKTYVELVKTNLGPEIMARVAQDKDELK